MSHEITAPQITVKTCNKCKAEKETTFFNRKKAGKYGVRAICKLCESVIVREKYLENMENGIKRTRIYSDCNREKNRAKNAALSDKDKQKNNKKSRDYYEKNKDSIAAQKKKYRELNKGIIAEKKRIYEKNNKLKVSECKKLWYLKNRESSISRSIEYHKNKNKTDSFFSFKTRIRSLIKDSFRRLSYTKKSRTHEILGCSFEDFKLHLESTFTEGMSWELRDKLHIDHIIPLASAKTEDEVLRLNHHTNLQMLWATDNIVKSDKMPPKHIQNKIALAYAKATGEKLEQLSLF